MQRFNDKSPLESVVLTFNYVLFLPPGIFLTGTPVITISLLTGSDPGVALVINGPPAIDLTGTLILQPVKGGLDANDYVVTATCPTTSNYWAPALPALLPCRSYPAS